jgi:hypothetical protein
MSVYVKRWQKTAILRRVVGTFPVALNRAPTYAPSTFKYVSVGSCRKAVKNSCVECFFRHPFTATQTARGSHAKRSDLVEPLLGAAEKCVR